MNTDIIFSIFVAVGGILCAIIGALWVRMRSVEDRDRDRRDHLADRGADRRFHRHTREDDRALETTYDLATLQANVALLMSERGSRDSDGRALASLAEQVKTLFNRLDDYEQAVERRLEEMPRVISAAIAPAIQTAMTTALTAVLATLQTPRAAPQQQTGGRGT